MLNLVPLVTGLVPNDQTYFLEFDIPNALRFMVRQGAGNQNDFIVTTSLVTGRWYHLAAVRSGNTSTIYLDGTSLGSQTAGTNVDTGSGGSARIGEIAPNGVATRRPFPGQIDELTLYDRALLASEIQIIFNAGIAGKCVDATPPTFGSCPAGGPFLLNSGSQSVGPIAAEDPESGIDAANSLLTGAVDTSAVGPQTVTFLAVNTEGSEATKDCEYDVHYHFSGFFQPIDNTLPNAAKAGQTIPVKWRLTDAHGAPVADPQSFVNVSSSATPGACGGAADAIETYAGTSGLQYLGDGSWQFNWKTPKAYAGQCRTMRLNLTDGASGRTAAFIFK